MPFGHQHDWSEGKAFQTEGVWGNLVSSIVNGRWRDMAKIHLWWIHTLPPQGEETGKGKPVLYDWSGNNPMMLLGAWLLGQFWVLFNVVFLGRSQTKFSKNISISPDFGEQCWIRKTLWFRILLLHWRWFLQGEYEFFKRVVVGEVLLISRLFISPKKASPLRRKGGYILLAHLSQQSPVNSVSVFFGRWNPC